MDYRRFFSQIREHRVCESCKASGGSPHLAELTLGSRRTGTGKSIVLEQVVIPALLKAGIKVHSAHEGADGESLIIEMPEDVIARLWKNRESDLPAYMTNRVPRGLNS